MLRMTEDEIPSIYGHVTYTLDTFPRQIRLESSSICNMACVPCHGHGANNKAVNNAKSMMRTKGRMPMEMFEAAIDEIATWDEPLHEISPTNFGEWFMHPKWYEQGKMIEERLPGTSISFPTTGVLINDQILDRLVSLRALRFVNFSINAFFGETYEHFHGVPATHLPRVRKIVEEFKRRRPDIHVQVSMVYDPITQTEIEKQLFQTYWAPITDVAINATSYCDHPSRRPDPPVVIPCRSVFDGLVVFSDGRVGTGCCFDADAELVVGHFPEQSLLEIWRGEPLKKLAETHNSGKRADLRLCKGCSFA